MNICVTFLVAFFILGTTNGDEAAKETDPSVQLKRDVQQSLGNFALTLNKAIVNAEEGKNVIISPFSIYVALALTLMGSAGNTRKEIVDVMKFSAYQSELEKPHSVLSSLLKTMQNSTSMNITLANAVFVDKKFQVKESYKNDIRSYYEISVIDVDFAAGGDVAQNTINNWVKDKTHGKIGMLYKNPLDAETRMLIVNSLYFDAEWQYPFNTGSVTKGIFHAAGNKNVEINYMSDSQNVRFYRSTDNHYQAITLPYRNRAAYMGIILPDADSSLKNLNDILTPTEIRKLIKESTNLMVNYQIPKMKLSYSHGMKDVLKTMGINDAFETVADLTNIAPNLYIHEVQHATDIDVTEFGTVAASITVVEILPGLSMPYPFTVDRPFYFYIYHRETAAVLFSGAINDPSLN